ncbi:MAG: site-specific integrase [Gammaproteobacteria bacterium]|jgi:integrase|nr:site-specific integrase [Gammaproteobacteria bacterium]
MAYKSRLNSGKFRIQIRVKGLKSISSTFPTEKEADAYAVRIESELNSIRDAEKAKLPIDMAALFRTLHPDLKKVVQLMPTFARVLGEVAGNELTLSRLIDQFMFQYEKKDPNIEKRLKWWSIHYGHLLVNEVSEDHVRHGINKLLTVGSTGKSPVSPQTTNRFKANLSSVFEFGKNKYHLKMNPCRFIKSKPEGKGRKRYLSPDEQERLVLAAKKSKWNMLYLLIMMAITSGARRGELEKLRWCDIDWELAQAHCKNTKNGSDKILHLTDVVMAELKKHRNIGNGLIFSGPNNAGAYDFRMEWMTALDHAEIALVNEKGEKLVFHSLRHTFCSTLANTGAELHEIASLAGHKSIQTTMRYTHLDNKRLSSVVIKTFEGLGAGV